VSSGEAGYSPVVGRPEEMRLRRRRRRRLKYAGLAAVVVALVGGGVAGYEALGTSSRSAPNLRSAHPGHVAPAVAGASAGGPTSLPTSGPAPTGLGGGPATTVATMVGTSGVEAQWVLAENRRAGTSAWQIVGTPPGRIAGYANQASAVVGDTIALYVSTDAPTFQVQAYRMGWYGGTGARLVWTSPSTAGTGQPACPVDHTTNMVSCDGWKASLSIAVSSEFVQGDYLLKLVGSGGQASYVPLTVRDPSSHATYLLENDIYTWQAWNPYGGYDFYAGIGSCPAGIYPVCNRARVVSFDRPYDYGQGAADFLGNEYPLVRFAEQRGLDVTYATSADFEQNPAFLLQHRALLSLGHDECWSYLERQAAVAAEAHGVNMIFFGASPILRHVRMEPSPLGPNRQEVDYRDSSADPLNGTGPALQVTGNTWSNPPASWSEVPFVGENYTGYVRPGGTPVAYTVFDGASWLFAGTGLQTGSQVPGLLVSDFDQVQPGVSPANVRVLAHSPMPVGEVQSNVRDPASDTSYYTDPKSGAGVFDTGTVSWIPDLSTSPVVGQMTANLLALFGTGPTGLDQPSVANWRAVYISG
jgi:hypothetical protein